MGARDRDYMRERPLDEGAEWQPEGEPKSRVGTVGKAILIVVILSILLAGVLL